MAAAKSNLAVICLAMIGLAACAPINANSTARSCAVAQAAVGELALEAREQYGRKVLFSTDEAGPIHGIHEEFPSSRTWWRVDQSARPRSDDPGIWRPKGIPSTDADRDVPLSSIDKDLLRRLSANGPGNAVVTCPAIQGQLLKDGLALGNPTILTTEKQLDGLYSATIYTISLPILSDDGQTAIIVIDSVSGPQAGAGWLNKMERGKDGRWITTGMMGLWVS